LQLGAIELREGTKVGLGQVKLIKRTKRFLCLIIFCQSVCAVHHYRINHSISLFKSVSVKTVSTVSVVVGLHCLVDKVLGVRNAVKLYLQVWILTLHEHRLERSY